MKKYLSGILAAAVACGSAICLTTAAGAAEDGGFVLQGDADGADQADVGFPPGVDGLAVEGEGLELAWGDPEGLGGGLAEEGLVPADGEDEVVHLQHGGVPSLYIM